MNSLFIIGITQALFFSLFLITKRENQAANRLLVLLLILISFSLFLNYSYLTGLIRKIPFLIGVDNTFPFLYGPILYLYARLLISKNRDFRISDLFHFTPFFLYFLYVFFSFYLRDNSYKLDFLYRIRNSEVPLDIIISNFLKIIQSVLYFVLTLKLIYNHQKSIIKEFSYTERISLNWLLVLTYSLTSVYILKLFGILLPLISNRFSSGEIETITDISVILFIYIIAFGSIKQSDIFLKWHSTKVKDDKLNGNLQDYLKRSFSNVSPEEANIPKYAGSPLSEQESKHLMQKLLQHMTEERVYLQSELTIKDVADNLNVNTKYLSQVINEQLGQNFFNFINEYRVSEVKKRLSDNKFKHFSILGIALECGFNSKSSFNNIFKKTTGQTPSQYISAHS